MIRFLRCAVCWLLLACAIAVAMATRAAASGKASLSPDAAVRGFFDAVRRHDYHGAYGALSRGAQQQVPYGEFARRSADIRTFQVMELAAIDRGSHLVRYRVKGRVKMVYRANLFDAVYAGTADITASKEGWRISSVDLKPVSQKLLGPAPDYHI